MDYSFILLKKAKYGDVSIGRFEALIPNVDNSGKAVVAITFPKYIRISDGSNSAIFKAKHENIAKAIIVGTSIKLDIAADAEIEYESVKEWQYLLYRLFRDTIQRILLVAYIIGFTGAIITSAFAIGKIKVFIPVSETWCIIWQSIGSVLTLAGLSLAFFKNLKEAK